MILAGWFVAELKKKKRNGCSLSLELALPSLCFAIIFCGLLFHLYNLWLYGNPLYPAELRVFGLTILPGRYNASVFIHHGWSPAAFSKMLLSDTGVLRNEQCSLESCCGWRCSVPLGLLVLRRLKPADWLPTALFVFYPLASHPGLLCCCAVLDGASAAPSQSITLLWCGMGWSLHLLTRERSQATGDSPPPRLAWHSSPMRCFFLFL